MQPVASPIQSGVVGSGQTRAGGGQREQFAPDELAIAISHFDIGVIESITEFPRGSRKAPKVLITSEHGKFLLKRRARGKDEPQKVAFTHAIQMHLAAKQFPLPHLIGTKRENNSMLQWRNGVYELFEYIPGQGYPQTLESTFDSGRVLALYHKLLEGFKSEWKPPAGSYHMAPAVEQGLRSITTTAPAGLANNPQIMPILTQLLQMYSEGANEVEKQGIENW